MTFISFGSRTASITAVALLMLTSGGCAFAQNRTKTATQKVVVISLDAFGAESLHDPQLPTPTLHQLMKMGSYATSMHPINPTVTWPNHTAMVTGVNASRHHVVVNGLVINQRTGKPSVDADAPKSQLVAVPTVYDAAHEAGMTTAEVDWVAITKASSIDWRFSERPDPDGPIEGDLIEQGVAMRDDLAHFGKPSQAWRDRLYTLAAADIIKKHHPDLMLLHLLALDGIEHKSGFDNDSGRNTMAFLDDRVKEIIEAVRAAGDLDRTTFFIVSDHGQQSVHKLVHANLLLKQAGFLDDTSQDSVRCLHEGGFTLVYERHATPELTAKLKALFEGKAGVRSALTPAEAAKDGWPVPQDTNQAPDLLLYAADDYSFSGADSSELITETKEVGTHGYPNSVPLMQSIFIAAGSGVRSSGEFPAFSNVDVAPTIARLLGVELDNIDGKPLLNILK